MNDMSLKIPSGAQIRDSMGQDHAIPDTRHDCIRDRSPLALQLMRTY
jgi:hypothetical protein